MTQTSDTLILAHPHYMYTLPYSAALESLTSLQGGYEAWVKGTGQGVSSADLFWSCNLQS